MNIQPVALAVLLAVVLTGCRRTSPQAEHAIHDAWAAPGLAPKERADILNRFFANGTPITTVVGLLGPEYIRVTPYSMVSVDGGPVMCFLVYTNQRVTIGTSVEVGSGVDLLAGTFTGAGYELDVQTITNKPGAGQPGSGGNR